MKPPFTHASTRDRRPVEVRQWERRSKVEVPPERSGEGSKPGRVIHAYLPDRGRGGPRRSEYTVCSVFLYLFPVQSRQAAPLRGAGHTAERMDSVDGVGMAEGSH